MTRQLILILFLLNFVTISSQSITHYSTAGNHFAHLTTAATATIENGCLTIDNKTTVDMPVIDTTQLAAGESYKYYVRIANDHNYEGKSYKVTGDDGKSKRLSSTSCGIMLDYTGDSYWKVAMECKNSNPFNETLDRRTMTVSLARVEDGKSTLVKEVSLADGVNLDDGFNYLGATVDGNVIKVMTGRKELKEVFSYQVATSGGRGREQVVNVGFFSGAGSKIKVEKSVLSRERSQAKQEFAPVLTSWTRESLDRHFAASKNPYEGYWTYLDRDMEETWLKSGGRYTLALVETPSGYDVIYVDGAQVKKSLWTTGMLKGRMTKTIFTDNFTGMWIDATFEPIDKDVYVTFESGVILSFGFPVYKSQMRFSKVLDN